MEFENLIGQIALDPCSDGMRDESRGTRETWRFPERNNEQLMKHVFTIGSQTREGSTGCVGERKVIDQLRDDQMNHVSIAKCVYWMLQDVEDAERRLQSQPSAQEKSKPAAWARNEFKQRSDDF